MMNEDEIASLRAQLAARDTEIATIRAALCEAWAVGEIQGPLVEAIKDLVKR